MDYGKLRQVAEELHTLLPRDSLASLGETLRRFAVEVWPPATACRICRGTEDADHKGHALREACLHAIMDMGHRAVSIDEARRALQTAYALLGDSDPHVRVVAVAMLHLLSLSCVAVLTAEDTEGIVNAILPLMKDTNPHIRFQAARSLPDVLVSRECRSKFLGDP
jgi:HEAT repeat protein